MSTHSSFTDSGSPKNGQTSEDESIQRRAYLAILVLQCDRDGEDTGDWDIQHHLIFSPALRRVYDLAVDSGRQAEHSYRNEAGELVSWKFKGLAGLYAVDQGALESGGELFGFTVDSGHPVFLPKEKKELHFLLEEG